MKVVINACYGGFSLSAEALAWLKKHGCAINQYDIERNDPYLVEVVETFGDLANGECAKLKVVEIPDDVQFVIQEYDGYEHIAEKHRTWHGI
jgi:hypothetical protein